MTDYDDEYPTCLETNAVLRIRSDELLPEEISEILDIQPSKMLEKGELRNPRLPRTINKTNFWFLSSESSVQSKDNRRHLDWLAERLLPKIGAIQQLRKRGAKLDVMCI